ncbi:uncharacterized protein LOC103574128 [Microplitis demolitor]|uniref:uncharacterized protein LOC103574128 n=1 Tax=Microplitis demolitor TaxID=69319 RepID=UPI0004CD69C6|nr:uncharacterized protein LOC103574128 [Microplitis demolitor]
MIIELGNINTEIELKTLFVTKSHLSHSITADFFNITHVNMKLCDICNKLSDFYAIPTLLAIIYFIASCTFYLYVLYISLTNDAQKFPCILVHILFAMSFFKITSNFIVLITCTARIKRELKKTAYFVHLILDQNAVDKETEETLIEFSRDLLHCDLEFSTYGIISIDGSLLQLILGTIITYLVLLIKTY